MNFLAFVIITAATAVFLGCNAQNKPSAGSVYDNCGQRHKRCFGDTDVCVSARNCTFALSLTENRTHVDLIMLNNCVLPNTTSKDFLLGIGLTTNDNYGNPECREPTLDDFKAFIFWNKIKCTRKAFFYSELNWMSTNKANFKSNCEYGRFVNGTRPREDFVLGHYLQNHMRLSSGDTTPPFNFADKVDYIVKDRALYINRHAPIEEPQESGFEVRPSNNNNNNMAHGSMESPQQSDDHSSSSMTSMSSTLLYAHLFAMIIFLVSIH